MQMILLTQSRKQQKVQAARHWWGIAAWPVDGFIAANDFTGKTVIPFCTSEDDVTEANHSVDVPTLETEAIQEGTDTGKGQSGLGTV